MPHEISAAAASRDRHDSRKNSCEVGSKRPSALLEKVLANSALRGAQGTLLEGGQDGQLSLGDAPETIYDRA